MKIIGYTRVSTDSQDMKKQRHLLQEYAFENQFLIDKIIEVEVSAQKNKKDRKIDQLLQILEPGDKLLVAELSRLGRNMLETLNIINSLAQNNIEVTFIRQPELSTATGPHQHLLLAIYSYFAEAEREFISIRTKQGLQAAKEAGVKLGRPKGSKNKKGRVLDPYKSQIKEYIGMDIPLASIRKIINQQLDSPISYTSFKYFVENDKDLKDFKK